MNRHDTDVVSLTFGVVFAALVGWWLLLRWIRLAAPAPGWLVAGALLVLGTLGILTTLGSWRRPRRVDAHRQGRGQRRTDDIDN